QIAVDDPGLVRSREPAGNVDGDRKGPARLEGTTIDDLAGEAVPGQELHHAIGAALRRAPVVDDVDDVGVLDARRNPGLLREALGDLGLRGVALTQDLDRER